MHPIQDLLLEGFSYVLQIDMHFICTPMWTKFYSCKKWVLHIPTYKWSLCKGFHERRKDMRAAMCTCITHTRARFSHFTRYYRITCDLWLARSRRDMVCLMSSLFLSCIFYWLILPHLDWHVNHDRLHVERFQGAVSGIWANRIWDGLGPSIYIGDVLYTEVLKRFIQLSENRLTFYTTVSPPCRPFVRRAADRGSVVSPNRRWWSKTCTGAEKSGFWEVRSHDRSCSSFSVFFIDDFFIYSCMWSTVSRSPSCSWYNGDLMDRSVVYLSRLMLFVI
jgi:hypothetical protein